MRVPNAVIPVTGLILVSFLLVGCSLEAAMTTCADCGEVRSVKPRVLRTDIRLITYAPEVADADPAGAPVVYDIRVRMDRGGSRDFVVSGDPGLRVGDRVEISGGAPARAPAGYRWS